MDNKESISAIFDLKGFTWFSSENPDLITDYCQKFTKWILDNLKILAEDDINLSNPYFIKYLGDGFLFLWDLQSIDIIDKPLFINNIIDYLHDITLSYNPINEVTLNKKDERNVKIFYELYEQEFPNMPKLLRCGVSIGMVSKYNSNICKEMPEDYIGVCINLASRLQKIHNSILFSANIEFNGKYSIVELSNIYKKVKVKIRGFKNIVPIYVTEIEYNKIDDEEKYLFFLYKLQHE